MLENCCILLFQQFFESMIFLGFRLQSGKHLQLVVFNDILDLGSRELSVGVLGCRRHVWTLNHSDWEIEKWFDGTASLRKDWLINYHLSHGRVWIKDKGIMGLPGNGGNKEYEKVGV